MPLSPFTSTPLNSVCQSISGSCCGFCPEASFDFWVDKNRNFIFSGKKKQTNKALRQYFDPSGVFQRRTRAHQMFGARGWISLSEPSPSGCCCWKFRKMCTFAHASRFCVDFPLWVHKKAERVASMSLLLVCARARVRVCV